MMWSLLQLVLLVSMLVGVCKCQESDECRLLATCAQCIASSCVWCLDEVHAVNRSDRCQMRSLTTCQDFVDPPAVLEEVIRNEPLSDVVQMAPQALKLHLRPNSGEKAVVEFSVQQSAALPLDVYFLLDLSWSMQGVRDNFADQAESIVSAMRSVTSELRVGFGSFVEKPIAPFTSVRCEESSCAQRPKAFVNSVKLTDTLGQSFRQRVLEAELSENVDEPEASLDALLQVMVCDERIGWRPNARRVILLATDRDFHFAMDGRLLGLLEPNSGECGLDASDTYSRHVDYPSVSQIVSEAHSRSFALIFAVIPRYVTVWRSLADLMPGLGYVAILERDAANIVQLMSELYAEITSSITLKVEERGQSLRVKIDSECPGDFHGGNLTCLDVEVGTKVDFQAHVQLTHCPTEHQDAEDPFFIVTAVGLNQTLRVDVEAVCKCDECDNEQKETSDDECGKHGRNVCGVCECDEDFFGQRCECRNTDNNLDASLLDVCRPPSQDDVCSGRGDCICGQCRCFHSPRVYGKWCECDDLSCPRDQTDHLCSNHGICKCGKCVCDDDFSGDVCDCSLNDSNCQSPYLNGQICSERGKCVCNKCQCDESESGALYSGAFCHLAPAEVSPCEVLKQCVECLADFEQCQCDFVTYSEVTIESKKELSNLTECQLTNGDGCSYTFLHAFPKASTVYLLLNEDGSREVCVAFNAMILSGGIFASVIVAGLLALMAYKCIIVIDDRHMYAKHVRETERVWNAVNHTPNTMYRSPISRYENPTFRKNDQKQHSFNKDVQQL